VLHDPSATALPALNQAILYDFYVFLTMNFLWIHFTHDHEGLNAQSIAIWRGFTRALTRLAVEYLKAAAYQGARRKGQLQCPASQIGPIFCTKRYSRIKAFPSWGRRMHRSNPNDPFNLVTKRFSATGKYF
jgi:hypothetical protein